MISKQLKINWLLITTIRNNAPAFKQDSQFSLKPPFNKIKLVSRPQTIYSFGSENPVTSPSTDRRLE